MWFLVSQLAGGGYGVHWPDIDEDISTEGLVRGAPAPVPTQGKEVWVWHRQVINYANNGIVTNHKRTVSFVSNDSYYFDKFVTMLNRPMLYP